MSEQDECRQLRAKSMVPSDIPREDFLDNSTVEEQVPSE